MIHNGDCLDIMPTLPADSVDSIVTDPPYGLSFMGKDWDHGIPGVQFWREALRVAKPGAFLLAFGGTRTFHRLAVAIEDAGWEMRDTVMWVYGSGFPKSLDVGKAIDKAAGAGREIVGPSTRHAGQSYQWAGEVRHPTHTEDKAAITAPATPEAKAWDGWGTALKPAWEPIIVARKPLIGTVAENILRYGTGAINVDGARVGAEQTVTSRNGNSGGNGAYGRDTRVFERINPPGRWPANLIHDGSDEVTAGFPVTTSGNGSGPREAVRGGHMFGGDKGQNDTLVGRWHGDTGSAARFFYCAKASKADRDEGCEGLERSAPAVESAHSVICAKCNRQRVNVSGACTCEAPEWIRVQQTPRGNHHPTVKPTALMRYLVKLVTRRGGVVLDPFMGSGSTGKACAYEGMEFIGIDLSPEYCEIAARRIAAVVQPALTG